MRRHDIVARLPLAPGGWRMIVPYAPVREVEVSSLDCALLHAHIALASDVAGSNGDAQENLLPSRGFD